MEIVNKDQKLDSWEPFALASDDAWFWHSTDWMEYTQEYAGDLFVVDRSFFITENGKIMAICPLFVERSPFSEGAKQFTCSGSLTAPLALPAMTNGLSVAKRQEILVLYLETLKSLSVEEGVSYLTLRMPAIAKSNIEIDMPSANPLLRYGFTDLSYITRVIDLSPDETELWSDIRKGHRADIRRAEKSCQIKIWDQSNITPEKFNEYQQLHHKDNGRVTRTQRTFDLTRTWVERGNAILAEAEHDGRGIGFSLFVTYGNGAFYGSSCRDPEFMSIPASHLTQWSVMGWLKSHGYRWYEIGPQAFSPQLHDLATDKSASISSFKNGFGGRTIPSVTAEYFYSKELMEKVYRQRMDDLFSLISLEPAKV
jgi:hypothetical protein